MPYIKLYKYYKAIQRSSFSPKAEGKQKNSPKFAFKAIKAYKTMPKAL